MNYLYIKAIHIIFIVTWFSGLFYLGRLFIYNREAMDKPEPEKTILHNQLSIMISRLYWAITVPSAVLTLIFGSYLATNFYPFTEWLWIKLFFVTLLYAYQYMMHVIYLQQKAGIFMQSSQTLRVVNEVPTIILIAVVMLVVVKESMSMIYGVVGIFALIGLLMFAINLYKKIREK